MRGAIVAAFGSAPIGAVTALQGGATGAAPLCVEVGGRRYLVRAEGEASPLRNPHQYVSLRIAAEAGIAPRVHHVDEQARVAVTDFIEQQPLHTLPGGPLGLAQALGDLLRRLQETPVFPHFVDYPAIVGRLFAHVRRTGLFAPGALDEHTERLERVSEAYAAGVTLLVSSHNDFIPANILFDGARLWAIDWESAYRNDPLVDVATALDTQARTPELEEAMLRAWLGRAPDETVRTPARSHPCADTTLLCRRPPQRVGRCIGRGGRYRPRGADAGRVAVGDPRRPACTRHAGDEACAGQDVPRLVPVGHFAAGIRCGYLRAQHSMRTQS